MAAVPRRLKRIEVYCPEYKTTAAIRINDAHSSGTDHLEVDYRSPDHSHFSITIPDDWTDQDLLELIFLPPRDEGPRNWPAWEIPAYQFVSSRRNAAKTPEDTPPRWRIRPVSCDLVPPRQKQQIVPQFCVNSEGYFCNPISRPTAWALPELAHPATSVRSRLRHHSAAACPKDRQNSGRNLNPAAAPGAYRRAA
jgi:hypothetical protein